MNDFTTLAMLQPLQAEGRIQVTSKRTTTYYNTLHALTHDVFMTIYVMPKIGCEKLGYLTT